MQHLLDEANEPVGAVRVQEIVAAARGRGGGTHGGGSGGGSARAGCGRTRGRMEIASARASVIFRVRGNPKLKAHGHTPTHIHTPTRHGPWGSNVDKSQAAAVRPEGEHSHAQVMLGPCHATRRRTHATTPATISSRSGPCRAGSSAPLCPPRPASRESGSRDQQRQGRQWRRQWRRCCGGRGEAQRPQRPPAVGRPRVPPDAGPGGQALSRWGGRCKHALVPRRGQRRWLSPSPSCAARLS